MGQSYGSGQGKTKSATGNAIMKNETSIIPRESQGSCQPFCKAAKTAWRTAAWIARAEAKIGTLGVPSILKIQSAIFCFAFKSH